MLWRNWDIMITFQHSNLTVNSSDFVGEQDDQISSIDATQTLSFLI